jgi:hypothetical protein
VNVPHKYLQTPGAKKLEISHFSSPFLSLSLVGSNDNSSPVQVGDSLTSK